MSLPSKAVFKKNNKVVSEPFINCGWFHEGMITTIRMIEELYKNGNIPKKDDYDTVEIYDFVLSRKEVDYIIQRMMDKNWKHYIPEIKFEKIELPIMEKSFPKLIAEEIVNVQPLQDNIFPPGFLNFNEIVKDIPKRLFKEDLEYFRNINEKEDDFLKIHIEIEFKRWIRNYYKLWDKNNPLTMKNYEEDIIDGVDYNPKHPDNMSDKIFNNLLDELKKE